MSTLLKFLWGLIKFALAFVLLVTAFSVFFSAGDGTAWWAVPIALIGMAFHWRFWIVAIPAFGVGFWLARR